MLARQPTADTWNTLPSRKSDSVFDTPVMYGYPRGASLIVTVSPLWLFSWSLCYWTKMVFLCYCDHGKWCGKEKPITLPNGQTRWSLHRPNTHTHTHSSGAVSQPRPVALTSRWPVVGTPTLLFRGDNVMSEVINIGNVPAMGAIVLSDRRRNNVFGPWWQPGWLEHCRQAL